MDGTDSGTWDSDLDGLLAAPENHMVLYGDDLIHVLSVNIAPCATEKQHHHRLPSIFVLDRMVKLRGFNGVTGEEIALPIPENPVFPTTVKFLAHLSKEGVNHASQSVAPVMRNLPRPHRSS